MQHVQKITQLFEQNRNDEQAIPMENYMKNHFPFLGIKTPLRRELLKQFFAESGILKETFNHDFVLVLWEKEEREYQYAALDYMGKSIKKLQKSDITLMEQLITSKPWWDTIDTIAPHAVGKIASDYPEVIQENIEGWAYGEHLWLRRAAILFQLKYKDRTNEELLYRYIVHNANSKEFFIQKAIGWVLREYSKTNRKSVKSFIDNHELPKLSIREGSKYL